jgi:copper chaperone CopZ
MHCQGCGDSITTALTEIPGVQSAKVTFADKQAIVVAKESEVPTEKILAVIAEAGYQGEPAPAPPAASGKPAEKKSE